MSSKDKDSVGTGSGCRSPSFGDCTELLLEPINCLVSSAFSWYSARNNQLTFTLIPRKQHSFKPFKMRSVIALALAAMATAAPVAQYFEVGGLFISPAILILLANVTQVIHNQLLSSQLPHGRVQLLLKSALVSWVDLSVDLPTVLVASLVDSVMSLETSFLLMLRHQVLRSKSQV